jgi:polysaccharide biosynthesis transport protein
MTFKHDVYRVTMERKLLLAGVFVGINALTLCVFAHLPAKYEAVSYLLAQDDNPVEIGRERADSILRQDQFLNSEVQILQSQTVVHAAVSALKPEILYPNLASSQTSSLFGKAINWLRPESIEQQPIDVAYQKVASALSVRAEPRTNLIRISFVHGDPYIAAALTRVLVNSFFDLHAQLAANNGTTDFVEGQKQRYVLDSERASARISEFAQANSIFDMKEQQKLLLSRRSDLLSGLASTRSSVAEKEAEAHEFARQLANLKLTKLLAPVAAMALDAKPDETSPKTDPSTPFIHGDPPLLLVRVYQDTVQLLVRTNSEVVGFKSLGLQQEAEVATVEKELNALVGKEAKFYELQQDFDLARQNAAKFAEKAFEQDLDAALAMRKFSKLRVVEEASRPTRPIFPQPVPFLVFGLLLSTTVSGTLAFLLAYFNGSNHQLNQTNEPPDETASIVSQAPQGEWQF